MFRITHNTLRHFGFSEILLMVAINQLEAEQKIPQTGAKTSVRSYQ